MQLSVTRSGHLRRIRPKRGGPVRYVKVKQHRVRRPARGGKPRRRGRGFADVLKVLNSPITVGLLKAMHAAAGTLAIGVPVAYGIHRAIKNRNN
jgi:hypothetical protein